MHVKESRRSSNSGHLLPLALANASMRIRGVKDQPLNTEGLHTPEHRSVLLFPSADAEILDAAWANGQEGPIHLIVPDGNWRQAKRMSYREPALADLPRVRLAAGPPSKYRLRHHPEPTWISTFEAVSRVLGILEGYPIQEGLEQVFDCFVERSLWARGDLKASHVSGGIPDMSTASTDSRRLCD